jgi:hypothetical protein
MPHPIVAEPNRRESFGTDGKPSIITKRWTAFKKKREKSDKCPIKPIFA